jgi:hypothetical protein
MNTHTRVLRGLPVLLGLLLCAFVAPASPVAAQASDAPPVFLALPQSFPDIDARAVVLRETGRDIVLLREEDASAETLEVALRILERMRRDHPRPEGRGQMIPITGFVYRAPLEPDLRQAREEAIAELRERPLANVGNLGRGRWMAYRAR